MPLTNIHYSTPCLESVRASMEKADKLFDPAGRCPIVSTATGCGRVLENLLGIIFGCGTLVVGGAAYLVTKKKEWKVCCTESLSFKTQCIHNIARGIIEAFAPFVGNLVVFDMDKIRREAQQLEATVKEQADKLKALPTVDAKNEELAKVQAALASKTKELETMVSARAVEDSSFSASAASDLFSESVDEAGKKKEGFFHKWTRERAVKKLASRQEQLAKVTEQKQAKAAQATEKAAVKEEAQKALDAATAARDEAKAAYEQAKKTDKEDEMKKAFSAKKKDFDAAETAFKKAVAADKKAARTVEKLTATIETLNKKIVRTQARIDKKNAELEPQPEVAIEEKK